MVAAEVRDGGASAERMELAEAWDACFWIKVESMEWSMSQLGDCLLELTRVLSDKRRFGLMD